MAPPRGLAENAKALLTRLYATGERCDLLIRCSKKGTKHYHEFKVHKCLVYPAIPILDQIEIKNRNFTIVNLAESANVVDAMLRHLYKVPIGCVPEETDTEEQLRGKADLESVELAIELFLNAKPASPAARAPRNAAHRNPHSNYSSNPMLLGLLSPTQPFIVYIASYIIPLPARV